jgi:phosphoribosylaminoimidazolecarboxamide formyltransferase / IMP cyclohydrolase
MEKVSIRLARWQKATSKSCLFKQKGERILPKWALVSVFDKTGIVPFCTQLLAAGYGILSTGGTARHLVENGIAVTQVEDYTGFPEMMDGRVKTLHPKIHGGLLGLRDNPAHVEQMQSHGIDEIDVVVVNLYPFEATIQKPGVTFAECVEMIDIGGPSMLRSAAKNHKYCIPVVDPVDYDWVGKGIVEEALTEASRRKLAAKVFQVTGKYDAMISTYLLEQEANESMEAAGALAGLASADQTLGAQALTAQASVAQTSVAQPEWPNLYTITGYSRQELRYGENPHQAAHFYRDESPSPATIAGAKQLQGKELSYNNIQDADAALNLLRALDDLGKPAAVAVKHMNPCGVGIGETIHEAYVRAYEADSVSIFGGIVAFNRPVDKALADQLTELFLEIVIAPSFTEDAIEQFKRKKNVRLLTVNMEQALWKSDDVVFKRVSGGFLVQGVNLGGDPGFRVVTDREPTGDEIRALQFAWRIVRFVKSNAIVLTSGQQTLGIGAGQMNRVGAAKIAIEQAGALAKGSVLASDAFFPMRDTVDTAAKAGVTALIQPGGSIRDKESIEAANEHGLAMVFTGIRHFWH